MQLSNDGLRPYFQRELHALREEATDFSNNHPSIARELGLSRGESRDPQVELLMQSFSWLTGRLNFRLDEDRGLLPNLLLGLLYPHLQAPLPSMVVSQIKVKADGANFAEGWTLKRNRQMYIMAKIRGGEEVACRFSTLYDTPLLPLEIDSVKLVSANEISSLSTTDKKYKDIQSVLRVDISRQGDEDIKNVNLSTLRFHIHGDDRHSFDLYELLSLHCKGIWVRANNNTQQLLDQSAITWLGFDTDHAALPTNTQTHPGFRLLQEYFAFREKFMFFDIAGINAENATDSLQLLFLLDTPPKTKHIISRNSLRLNCVPVINLYPQRLEPLRLDQREYEHRLIADGAHHRYCEIHTLLELSALQADGSERELAPYFSADQYDPLISHDYFYLTRRAQSSLPSVPGTELYASFLDGKLDMGKPPGDAIVGRALCTNRRLAEHLGPNDLLELEGAGPVEHIHLLGKPNAHRSPRVLGDEPWSLLTQLVPNYLSLSEHTDSLGALKRMLSLHCNADLPENTNEINGLSSLICEPSVQHLRANKRAWRGLARGLSLTLKINDEAFETGSALLFGEVLQRFFALYVAVNSFTALTLEGGKSQGVIKKWPPMIGDRIVL